MITLQPRMRRQIREHLIAYAFLAPAIIGFAIFFGYPFIQNFVLSFQKWNLMTPPQFKGFDNYIRLFTNDRTFASTLKATFIYVGIHVPIVVGSGLLVAHLLNNSRLRGLSIFRTIMFTPLVTAPVAIGVMWAFVFNTNIGLLNAGLQIFGVEAVNWLGKADTAMFALLVVSIWRGIGYAMVFFLAGLQSIPAVYYEAAKIDGANGRALFRHVTLPLITPTLFFMLVVVFIGAFQEFDLPFVLTNGGPRDATALFNLTIFRTAFSYTRFGYASAMSVVMFVVLIAVTILQWVFQRRWVFYADATD